MSSLEQLYRDLYGQAPTLISRLAGAGSNRVYYRLTGATGTCVGVEGTLVEENRAFVYLAQHFKERQLPVPAVLAVDENETAYLQEDLGDKSLFDNLTYENCRAAITALPRLQFKGAEGLDFMRCYPSPAFDIQSIMFDLQYFKYCFLKRAVGEFNEWALEREFMQLATELTASGDTFMHRDFQSRNVMLCNGEPYFIDFQGGRRGHYLYDVASFVWQAKAGYTDEMRERLISDYFDALAEYQEGIVRHEQECKLRDYALLRILQTLGAYGFRGYVEGKAHFLESIPPALHNVRRLIDEGTGADYTLLRSLLRRCADLPVLSDGAVKEKAPLCVTIYSFSYKRGIPVDESGNGGGYVFDCRGIHNPGRYDEYKQLTGCDQPVRDFLVRDGEILQFLAHVYALADRHIQRYLERGFTSLMFSFGCTGGQHRSVYSAEALAAHVRSKFPEVSIRLIHREQQDKQ